VAGGLSEIQQVQLDFWTAFSEFLGSSSFRPRRPAPKNWYYLPLGTGRAKIVVTMSVDQGRLECKLAIEHSAAAASPDQAVAIYSRLGRDRTAIEAELGFFDLDWGKPTPTRMGEK
jgi:Domain of unknown function (DUF4268)